jgi:hypothetical protein
MTAVESLVVRELKGVGVAFTPNLDAMLMFHGLSYKPPHEYESVYQVVAPPLNNDPRVMSRASRIAYVPAFSWSTFEVVLAPFKLTSFGLRVLDNLRTLQPRFPRYKCFTQWDAAKRRHVVYFDDLSEQELGVILGTKWPTRDEILDTLQVAAFDNLDALAAANAEIHALVHSREVQ